MRPWCPVLALVVGACVAFPPRASAGDHRSEAATLFASASARVARGTHEQRQFAIAELQRAVRLDPARSDIALALGQMYLEGDFLSRARAVADRLELRDPTNAEGWLLAGRVWRRYWLTDANAANRDRAIQDLAHGTRLSPRESSGWLLLAPLLVDAGELEAAHAAAELAARAAPRDPNAEVMLAAMAQRVGDLATAERLFESSIPRLPENRRERYADVLPLLPPGLSDQVVAMDPRTRGRFVERFWADADPDPASRENEARLEYWARVTQAVALYGPAHDDRWDLRALCYVRFGSPGFEELNPIDLRGARPTFDRVAWIYPHFGMRLSMSTGSVYNGFTSPIAGRVLAVWADRDSLERHKEWMPVYDGYAAFHRLPPGIEPLDARLAVARFESKAGTNLLAQVEARAGVGERLTAEWVVLDSAYAPVARDRRPLATSACRADEARASAFTSTLAPGRYRVAVQVSDESGRRGVLRQDLLVPRASDELELSDLVITCGSPGQSVVPGSGVRLEPETGLFPAQGDRLNAYLEVYRLAQSPSGEARFSYECVVRPVVEDRRGWWSRMFARRDPSTTITMSRVETTQGPLRRQFLSVPVGSLPSGSYQIEVRVRDVASGAEAKAVAAFQR